MWRLEGLSPTVWSFHSTLGLLIMNFVDADGLDEAPYRFETPGPTQTQPPPSLPRPTQQAPRPLIQTAVSQLLPDLQPPDPNNVYERLNYSEGTLAKLLLYPPLTSSQEPLHNSCKLSSPRTTAGRPRKLNCPRNHSHQRQDPLKSVQRRTRRRPT